MLKNYSDISSNQNITSKKLCFSAAILNFTPMTVISSLNAPKSRPILLSSFNDEQLAEIEKYLKSYAEKPYVIEVGGDAYIVIPSLYPTSTLCLLLRMDIEAKVLFRLIGEKPELFTVSENTVTAPARMSARLDAQKKMFFEFCDGLERAFMYLDRFSLSFSDDEVIDGYCEQVAALSEFLAVPLENIIVNSSDDGVPIKSNFALFTAFCTEIMMLARNEATDRKISVVLDFFGGSLVVKLSFKTVENIRITNETFLWEYLSADKRMLFEYHNEGGRFCVTFQPIFIDWSYLGIKQERNDILFDNEKE